MRALRELLQEAGSRRVAVGHFNFSELVVLKAAAEAAGELGVPVVMGVSESEREFLGVRQAAALVQSMREEKGREIFLNADHTHSIEKTEEAARAGFDMIVFDASEKPLEKTNGRREPRANGLHGFHRRRVSAMKSDMWARVPEPEGWTKRFVLSPRM
jgi:fructose-bisphosphate aldolase, class II